LTGQLLAFSRKQILEPRRLDVNRVVEGMLPMVERLVGEDIEVRVALNAEGGTIHADPHQLEQVVMNLVVNARDAMPGSANCWWRRPAWSATRAIRGRIRKRVRAVTSCWP